MEGALSTIPVEEVENELAGMSAGIAAATGRSLALIAELDRREAYAAQGFLSMAHWLSWRVGMALHTAREEVRVASALVELPLVTAALCDGQIIYSKARIIASVATPATEETLLEYARQGTAAQLGRIARGFRRANADQEAMKNEDRRQVAAFFDDGVFVIRGRLSAEEGALVMAALRNAKVRAGPTWLQTCPENLLALGRNIINRLARYCVGLSQLAYLTPFPTPTQNFYRHLRPLFTGFIISSCAHSSPLSIGLGQTHDEINLSCGQFTLSF